MTCTHVLGLIDAGPFADYPRAHLDAAWQHARQCATCGPALDAATSLAMDLTTLPQPAPPPDLTANVMARIARIDEATSAAMAGAERPAMHIRDWSAWATTLGGVAAAAAIVMSTPLGHFMSLDIGWPGIRGITQSLVTIPAPTTGTLALAAGLLLFAAGLFGPVSDRSRL